MTSQLSLFYFFENHKKKIGVFLFFLAVVFTAAVLTTYVVNNTALLSPVSGSTTFEFVDQVTPAANQPKRIVYGFLPYWNVTKATLQPEVSHLAYFSLDIDKDGTIETQTPDGPNPGYQRLSSDTTLNFFNAEQKRQGKVEIVLAQFDNDKIAAFLSNKTAHKNLLQSLDSLLLAYPLDGINIDIEYTGPVTQDLRNDYSLLIQEIHQHLQQRFPKVELSVDVMASAATDYEIWDLPQIKDNVNYVIIMAYDFHHSSSIMAGPVAPLFGGKRLWDGDVTQYLQDFLQQVPKQQILLGMPFYGYEWQTTSRDSQATTYPDTGAATSIDRVQELLQQKDQLQVQEKWNDDALAPYLSYKKNNQTYVIYYENSRSLSYKMDLVNQLDLGGVAIWALGYEGSSRELWDVIKMKI